MPAYDLSEIQSLVAQRRYVAARSTAKDPVITHYGCTLIGALKIMEQGIASLRPADFVETKHQDWGDVFDVYAMRRDEVGWYVKVGVRNDWEGEEEVLVISYHPLERTIRTRGGEVEP